MSDPRLEAELARLSRVVRSAVDRREPPEPPPPAHEIPTFRSRAFAGPRRGVGRVWRWLGLGRR
jgi:hypothetical protein